MEFITTLPALEALYGTPGEASQIKGARRITPAYRAWITRARFCILSTVGPEGTDASPRGEDASDGLPSVGDILKELTVGRFDGAGYDQDGPGRAEKSLC